MAPKKSTRLRNVTLLALIGILALGGWEWMQRSPTHPQAQYRYPLSHSIRLLGSINDAQLRYLAKQAGRKEYLVIPAKDCHKIDERPYCYWHHHTITFTTGRMGDSSQLLSKASISDTTAHGASA